MKVMWIYLREKWFIEETIWCHLSFPPHNRHVCLWIYKPPMEEAETAGQNVRRPSAETHPAWPVKSICVAPVSYAQRDCPSFLVVALHFHSTLRCRQRRNYSLTMRQWMRNFCPCLRCQTTIRDAVHQSERGKGMQFISQAAAKAYSSKQALKHLSLLSTL